MTLATRYILYSQSTGLWGQMFLKEHSFFHAAMLLPEIYTIVWVCSKKTTFELGNFINVYGDFFTIRIYIYLSQNLIANGHFEVLNAFETQLDQKLQDKTKKNLFLFFNFGRKNTENLRLINGHFLTTLGHFFAN